MNDVIHTAFFLALTVVALVIFVEIQNKCRNVVAWSFVLALAYVILALLMVRYKPL